MPVENADPPTTVRFVGGRGYLGSRVVLGAIGVGLIVSLAMNVVLLWQFLAQQRAVDAALAVASVEVRRLESETITYRLKLAQPVQVNTTIPLKTTFQTRIQTTVPVDTTVSVPISVLGQSFPITVPIQASVPIDVQVPVDIDEQVPLDTTVPVKLDVPIQVKVADTPLKGYLDRLDAAINRYRGN